MRRVSTLTLMAAAAFLAIAVGSGAASAQTFDFPSPYQVNYVSGSGGTVRLLNNGALRSPAFPGGPAFDRAPICANIYVYRPDEQLLACCSCPVTANGLRRLNVGTNLLPNPLQPPLTPPAGVTQDAAIKIVASNAAAGCSSPGAPTPGTQVSTPTAGTPYAPVGGVLHSWATHIQGAAGTGAGVTETESLNALLSAGELAALQQQCAFTAFLGTGAGICTCGPSPGSFFNPEEVFDGGGASTAVYGSEAVSASGSVGAGAVSASAGSNSVLRIVVPTTNKDKEEDKEEDEEAVVEDQKDQ